MKKLNPQKYDFIWQVNNQTWFITSLFLVNEYHRYDFLVTCKGSEWKMYLGKKNRVKLSKYGLVFVQKRLPQYQKKVNHKIQAAQSFFKKIKGIRISLLSNAELVGIFRKTITNILPLWRLYFYTEYFMYDGVQEKIDSHMPGSGQLVKKVQIIQKIKYKMRTILNQIVFEGGMLKKYLTEIQKRFKKRDIAFFDSQEIIGLLRGKKLIEINRRNYVFGKFNKWQIITDHRALNIIELFDKNELQGKQVKELHGYTANSGIYKGRVKIIPFDLKINLSKEIAKMKKGDILVSGSTGPEMILACKKAGAIVTEEGGICSHAAIVSRELNIPCVIGTKIATKVFKDGDKVEVDAVKGVVKKI